MASGPSPKDFQIAASGRSEAQTTGSTLQKISTPKECEIQLRSF